MRASLCYVVPFQAFDLNRELTACRFAIASVIVAIATVGFLTSLRVAIESIPTETLVESLLLQIQRVYCYSKHLVAIKVLHSNSTANLKCTYQHQSQMKICCCLVIALESEH